MNFESHIEALKGLDVWDKIVLPHRGVMRGKCECHPTEVSTYAALFYIGPIFFLVFDKFYPSNNAWYDLNDNWGTGDFKFKRISSEKAFELASFMKPEKSSTFLYNLDLL